MAGEENPHRPARRPGQVHGDWLEGVDVQLGAEGAAYWRLDDADVLGPHPHDCREVSPVEERHLRLRVEGELPVRAEGREDCRGPHAAVSHLLELEVGFDHVRALGLAPGEVAVAVVVGEF